MKDLMVAISGVFGRRYTGRQKEGFIRYIQEWSVQRNIKCAEDRGLVNRRICRNLYLGNVKRAGILLTIPYDTGTVILWPWLKYYPLNAGKNLRGEMAAKLLDLLLVLLILTAYILFVPGTVGLDGTAEMLKLTGLLILAVPGAGLLFGWRNGKNFSRNSASIVIGLECMKRFGQDKVAVALLDDSCCGFSGYRQLEQYLTQKGWKKQIVAMDCVISGEELHLHSLNSVRKYAGVQNHQISEDYRGQCLAQLFPDCQIITGGRRVGDDTAVSGTRSGRDDQINLDKMERMVELVGEMMRRHV